MKRIIQPRVMVLAALCALTIPAAASAEPGVYTVTQRLPAPGVTFATDPTGGGLPTTTQYVVTNNGWTAGFTETAGSGTLGGVLNYKVLPPEYRVGMTADEKRTYPDAQTNLQAHATCENVPQLDPSTGGANILAWQKGAPNTTTLGGAPVAEPYFNYIPWQKTGVTFSGAPAGANANLLGEDPKLWIPVVKTATATISGAPAGGVNLDALNTTQEFTSACTAIGGTYRKADAPSNIAASFVSAALAPFQTQVATLTGQVTKLTADKKAADAKTASTEAARLALINRTLTVSLARTSFKADQGVALVTGPVGQEVVVRLRKTGKVRTVYTREKLVIQSEGAVLANLEPSKRTLKFLKQAKRPVEVDVEVISPTARTTTPGLIVK